MPSPSAAPSAGVIAVGDAQDEVRRRYRDRLVAAVESRSALERVLCDLSEGLVTCVGPWPTLTVGVSEVLAEWAAENPARGCGVLPLWPKPRGQSLQPTRSQAERSTVALLWSGTELFDGGFVSPEGYQRASEQAVCRAVTSAHPPIAAAATGHGAEHCIRFGSRWLVSDQRLAPPGDTFPPARIGCPVVFLNCCSSARLGDCGIPQRYSLAATLGRRGKAVIGSFRNLHAVPQAGVEFARTLLSGTPLGQVVNAVNRASASWGESRPTFQLIGDAAQSWCAPAEAGALERPHPVVAAQLLLPLSLAWLDKLVATLCHWRTLGDGVQKAHGNMLAAERALCMA